MVLRVKMILLMLVMSLVGYSQMVVYTMPESLPPVSGYIAWYDSKDESSITKDGSNYVSQWNDKSGNGYNLTQLTGANQPTYSATNGIVFDGSNDYLYSLIPSKNSPFTCFIVWHVNASSNVQINIRLENTINGEGVNTFYEGYASYLSVNNGIFVSQIYSQANPFTSIMTTVNDVITSVYSNNVLKWSGNAGFRLNMNQISIGASKYYNVNFLNGYIREIIIYNSVLSTTDITSVNTYLNLKYGGIY